MRSRTSDHLSSRARPSVMRLSSTSRPRYSHTGVSNSGCACIASITVASGSTPFIALSNVRAEMPFASASARSSCTQSANSPACAPPASKIRDRPQFPAWRNLRCERTRLRIPRFQPNSRHAGCNVVSAMRKKEVCPRLTREPDARLLELRTQLLLDGVDGFREVGRVLVALLDLVVDEVLLPGLGLHEARERVFPERDDLLRDSGRSHDA